MGSRPFLPVWASVYFGLSVLVISAKTHRIWLVVFPQAKLTWPGSDATFAFWQAVVISPCTVATLGGHDAPFLKITITSTVTMTTRAAVTRAILRPRDTRTRSTLRRPWSMRALVRSAAPLVEWGPGGPRGRGWGGARHRVDRARGAGSTGPGEPGARAWPRC